MLTSKRFEFTYFKRARLFYEENTIIILLAFIQTNVIFVHLFIVVVTIVNKSKKMVILKNYVDEANFIKHTTKSYTQYTASATSQTG